jgi:glycerophosphoryl diester phosphodiesterase
MAAFEYAVGLGYSYLETDVHATRDGALIAFHDDRLDRVTDSKGLIAELDRADVSRARIGGKHPIPLLAELLDAWPTVRINVDAKSDRSVAPLIAAIKDLKARDRVCVGSFSDARIGRVRDAFNGKICTSLGPMEVLRFRAASFGVPVGAFPQGCAQVPMRAYGMGLVDKRLVLAADRFGLQVHVWTIDAASEMEALIDLGVHGIMTDRPTVLRDVLKKCNLWA